VKSYRPWARRLAVSWLALLLLCSGPTNAQAPDADSDEDGTGGETAAEPALDTTPETGPEAVPAGAVRTDPKPGFEPMAGADAVLERVEVQADRVHDPVRENPTRATNRITLEDIQRHAPRDLYETLQGTPGVVIEGGPRTQGKRIVIRGFGDNEDVLVRVDGATQNFEKYRYGTGVDIDPTLVRQVDVVRGAATLTQGSGALGGAVLIETLDANDLLRDDERWGTELRIGYATNDRSHQKIGNFYARPTQWLDLLVSQVSRQGEDFRLPSGETLPNSAENVRSGLFKAEVTGHDGFASLMHREGRFEGLQPLDATAGLPGIFGLVRRETSEDSQALQWSWNPVSWIDLRGSLGQTKKNVTDRGSRLAGGGNDFFDFDILTLDVRNRSEWDLGPFDGVLSFGFQGTRETRDTIRETLDTRRFVNLAQPPGTKRALGGFVEHALDWRNLRLTTALRTDRYQVNAAGPTIDLLRAQGSADELAFVRMSPGAGIEYVPGAGNLTFFFDWFEAFRPPLIDEFFTAGAFSRCQLFTRFIPRPTPPPGPPVAPRRGQFPPGFEGALAFAAAMDAHLVALDAYLAALDEFLAADAAWPANPLARANAICGDAYVPEEAHNYEIGASWLGEGLLRDGDHLFAKLTFYRSDVRNTLESIFEDIVTGEISQPGIERREGLEFELNYETGGWRLGLTGATVGGFFDLGQAYFTRNANPDLMRFTTPADRGPQPLFDLPGDTLQLMLLRRFGTTFEVGYRIRANGPRLVVVGARPGCPFILAICNLYDTEPGFVLHSVNAAWNPDPHVSVRITVENLTDTTYRLPGFAGGVGATAPGRSAFFTMGVRF
jgi:hemoglobin/transferrin/lactoferrin receptor protein